MKNKPMDAQELSKVYDEISEDSGKFKEMIEKNTADPEKIASLLDGFVDNESRYPELKSVDPMSASEFSALYRKMSEDVKATPDSFEVHTKPLGMTPDQLSTLFEQIAGGVESYPEIWDSQEKAQILHPRNLMMLASAFKENTREAIGRIRGIDLKD